ncbi:MAG: hypothetical protein JXJ22_03290 [Bacteroidales bacterium]|nr:hypothetical protein [Bacteroidales bacterium]
MNGFWISTIKAVFLYSGIIHFLIGIALPCRELIDPDKHSISRMNSAYIFRLSYASQKPSENIGLLITL